MQMQWRDRLKLVAVAVISFCATCLAFLLFDAIFPGSGTDVRVVIPGAVLVAGMNCLMGWRSYQKGSHK